jgi:Gpi18-like mannosyltransferase
MWGQDDSVFTAFLLAALYYILRRRHVPAMLYFGLAISIKFQAIFLVPFLLILLLRRRLSFASLFLAPAVLLMTFLPSWVIGRPIMQMILTYYNQMNLYTALSMNAPTFYVLINNSVDNLFNPGGIVIAAFILGLAVYIVYKLRTQLTTDLLVYLSAASLLLIPYLLPKMHERYFYPAEVFFLLVAFYRPRLAFITIGLQIATLATYDNFLFNGRSFLSLPNDSLLMLAMIIYVFYDLSRLVFANREIVPTEVPTEGQVV